MILGWERSRKGHGCHTNGLKEAGTHDRVARGTVLECQSLCFHMEGKSQPWHVKTHALVLTGSCKCTLGVMLMGKELNEETHRGKASRGGLPSKRICAVRSNQPAGRRRADGSAQRGRCPKHPPPRLLPLQLWPPAEEQAQGNPGTGAPRQ
eukprot:1158555-Pelagomonas_calceolata.AAC.5